MRGFRLYFLMFILVLVSFQVDAKGVVASVSKESGSVQAGEEAIFIVTVKNTGVRDDTFQLSINDFDVAPFSDVVDRISFNPSGTITVRANQEEDVKVRIRFLESAKTEKNYVTNLRIRSLTDPSIRTDVGLSAYVISPRKLVLIEVVDMPEIVVPGDEVTVTVKLRNGGSSDLESLDLFYTSPVFDYETKVNLLAFEEKEVVLPFKVDPLTEPGEYALSVRLFDDGKLKGSESFEFNVGESSDLREVEETRKGFLHYTIEIVRENEGNAPITKTVKYPITTFRNLFTNVDPEGELVEADGESYYLWTFEVPPGDIYRIEVTTDYRIPFLSVLVVLILIGIILYFRKKSVGIVKTVFRIGKSKDDNISELKILLHVKNKTAKEMYNVKLIDFLPRFVDLEHDFGTLRPSNIQEGSRGMRLIWKIHKLDPGDERVVTYKVKSKLSLIGRLILPAATVQYYGKRRQVVNVRSKRLIFKW